MAAVFVETILNPLSGMMDDRAVNTWAFEDGTESDPVAVGIDATAALTAFWTTVGPLIATSILRGSLVHQMKVYDLAAELDTPGAGLGTPILAVPFTIPAASSTTGLPSEVAICLSFHGALAGLVVEVGSTRPRSRHHGRVYIGPLNNAASVTDATNAEVRPAASALTTITGAGNSLAAVTTSVWSVWSRTNSALYEITGGWADNAFDTQRRRGVQPTARTTFGSLV